MIELWRLIVPVAHAATTSCPTGQFAVSVPINGTTCYGSFNQYLIDLIGQAINIAFGLAILVVLWGSFKYITAGGDDSKVKDAKDTIIGAVIGFALLLLIKVLLPLFQITT